MTTLTILIVVAFVLGYACIATESLLKVNKAAIALLMFVACWTLYMFDPMQYLTAIHGYTGDFSGMAAAVTSIIQEHLGDTSTTLFFLMGAMTIVEVVDQNGGFNWVRKVMKTKSKRALLWRIAFLTFILSAILDNLTTSIVMIMILRKLITERNDRLIYASLVIIAANSGGAFSPIGDVTTIMLWNKGLITAVGVISEILVPSLVSMVIPAFILQYHLKGELHMPEVKESAETAARRPHRASAQGCVLDWCRRLDVRAGIQEHYSSASVRRHSARAWRSVDNNRVVLQPLAARTRHGGHTEARNQSAFSRGYVYNSVLPRHPHGCLLPR